MPTTRATITHTSKKNRRTKKKKAPNNKQLATRIRRLEHTIEMKYKDFYTTSTWDDNVTGVLACVNVAQGDDFNQRAGEEIVSKYLNVYFRNVKIAAAAVAYYRIIIFWDLQANGGTPSLFASATNPNVSLIDDQNIIDKQLAPINYRTKHRYHVLYDKRYNLNPYGGLTSNFGVTKSKNFNLHNAKIKYASSTGTDYTSRALYIYYYCDDTSGVGATSDRLGARYWYIDP